MRLFLLVLALLALPASAQQTTSLCETPEADGLDFWVGTWHLTWTAASGELHGTNEITRDLDDCVVHERFIDETGFEGESVSVYTPNGWRQTWVDNSGGYLLFTGATHEDGTVSEMRMAPVMNPSGQMQTNRMTWEDITDDSLTWRWQSSVDEGATWTDMWVIYYTRRAE